MNSHDKLQQITSSISCKPGWRFSLRKDSDGDSIKLVITVPGTDSYSPQNPLTVSHFFPVPEATYNEASWTRWLFDCCLKVEIHEMGEWFKLGDRRPFAPTHGPGEDPYTLHEYRPGARRTNPTRRNIRQEYQSMNTWPTHCIHGTPINEPCPKCEKTGSKPPGFWSKFVQSLGEAIGNSKFGQ